jgi:putative salt-induced outer membrane protein
MYKLSLLAAALLASFSLGAQAQGTTAPEDEGWTGTGELGIAAARGNSRSENLNGKIAFANEDDQWKHTYSLSALRAKGEVTGDFDGDGEPEESFELNANRYEFAAGSALKMNEFSYWLAALRYENDDFAPFEHQTTFSLGYGHTFIKSDATELAMEIGPGYRRAKDAVTGESQSDAIVRGKIDYKHKLTSNTELFNTLLVEGGSDNTLAQNDAGVSVAMNEAFALKAGVQLRHNTDVGVGIDKTDTLTTVNLVYNIK